MKTPNKSTKAVPKNIQISLINGRVGEVTQDGTFRAPSSVKSVLKQLPSRSINFSGTKQPSANARNLTDNNALGGTHIDFSSLNQRPSGDNSQSRIIRGIKVKKDSLKMKDNLNQTQSILATLNNFSERQPKNGATRFNNQSKTFAQNNADEDV